jgi:hypothetical protein
MIIYTAIFGNYDKPAPTFLHSGVTDWIMFTDDINIEAPGWTVFSVPKSSENNTLNSRYWKHHPPQGKSLWVDGQIEIIDNKMIDLAIKTLDNHDLGLWRHPSRQCLYKEAEACFRVGHGHSVLGQSNYYSRKYSLPPEGGLWVTGVMARNMTEDIKSFQKTWWNHIVAHSVRDQISLPIVIHEHNIVPFDFPGSMYDFDLVKINYH